ncbi:hypothetical protein ACIQD3_14650 [Peribacillus loiseleuriae]|uniref:hypothetical protein n=1 Tax=Peribacillus loiseleuriae TaxID=1679170 RepID=UPI0038172D64
MNKLQNFIYKIFNLGTSISDNNLTTDLQQTCAFTALLFIKELISRAAALQHGRKGPLLSTDHTGRFDIKWSNNHVL